MGENTFSPWYLPLSHLLPTPPKDDPGLMCLKLSVHLPQLTTPFKARTLGLHDSACQHMQASPLGWDNQLATGVSISAPTQLPLKWFHVVTQNKAFSKAEQLGVFSWMEGEGV